MLKYLAMFTNYSPPDSAVMLQKCILKGYYVALEKTKGKTMRKLSLH